MEKNLSTELKKLRELHLLTLRQVEEVTGVSNAYLSQLENGKIRKPSANVLYKLGNLYGVTVDHLLWHAGIISNKINSEMIPGFKITEEEQEQLLDYLRFLRQRKPKPPTPCN